MRTARKIRAIPTAYYTKETRLRFSQKTTPSDDGCLNWAGAIAKNGYGIFSFYTINESAHRIAYEMHNNVRIPPSVLVRHTCHNKKCVNPSHLITGTHQQNSQDMVDAGRSTNCATSGLGEKNHNSKLTRENIEEIRNLIARGLTNVSIARKFGVSHSNISLIRRGKTWGEETN